MAKLIDAASDHPRAPDDFSDADDGTLLLYELAPDVWLYAAKLSAKVWFGEAGLVIEVDRDYGIVDDFVNCSLTEAFAELLDIEPEHVHEPETYEAAAVELYALADKMREIAQKASDIRSKN